MKKRLFIVAAIITLLIVGLFIYFLKFDKSKYKYENVAVNRNYFLMYENKYGVIDKSGNEIIKPKYDIIQIPNPEKPVFVCMKNYNSQTGEYISEVFNEKGEEIFTNFYKVEGIYIAEPEDEIFYQKEVLKYKENGKYGLVDFEGRKITKAKYDDIQSLEYKDGMLLVKEKNKYGIINLKGQKIIDSKYDKIESDCYYNENGGFSKARFYSFNQSKQ